MLTKQAKDSWRKRRVRANAHQLFVSEPSLLRIFESVCKTALTSWYDGCCPCCCFIWAIACPSRSCVWAISTLKQHSWMSHVLIPDTEGVSPSPCPVLVTPFLRELIRLRCLSQIQSWRYASRAAESVRLHRRPPPSPEHSRLERLVPGGAGRSPQPPPVPFFPEVHEEVIRSWRAPFSARNRVSASSVLIALDGGRYGVCGDPPQSSALLRCSFARGALSPGGVIHTSCPGLVGYRSFQRLKLTELLDKPPLPCMPWPSCQPTRPRHWSSFTRAVLTHVWFRSCAL